MKNSISLIGMAGAGKSSVGKELAAALDLSLIDSDDLIENQYDQTLQSILDQQGHIKLRAIEESVLTSINFDQTILSTGGSAVYSPKAMRYLQQHSMVIYLEVPFAQILERVSSFLNRGFAKEPEQTIEEAFLERQAFTQNTLIIRLKTPKTCNLAFLKLSPCFEKTIIMDLLMIFYIF